MQRVSGSIAGGREHRGWALQGLRWTGLIWMAWLVYFAAFRLAQNIACRWGWDKPRCMTWAAEHELEGLMGMPGWLWFPALTMMLWPVLPRRTRSVDIPFVAMVLLWSIAMAIMFTDTEAFEDLE